jgi:putative transposase
MAEGPRMTAAQLADKLLSAEHADVLRQRVAWIVAEPMEAAVTAQIGAELGQRTPDRVAQRNGYRPRAWDTRVGALELRIPRLRTGSYFPSLLEPRRRAERALVAVGQEADVNGVSTRRVDRLVEQLGIAGHVQRSGVAVVPRPGRAGPRLPGAAAGGPLPPRVARAKVERVREPGGSATSRW